MALSPMSRRIGPHIESLVAAVPGFDDERTIPGGCRGQRCSMPKGGDHPVAAQTLPHELLHRQFVGEQRHARIAIIELSKLNHLREARGRRQPEPSPVAPQIEQMHPKERSRVRPEPSFVTQ